MPVFMMYIMKSSKCRSFRVNEIDVHFACNVVRWYKIVLIERHRMNLLMVIFSMLLIPSSSSSSKLRN